VARKISDPAADCLPVMVPLSDKRLVPVSPDRVEGLRQHLLRELGDLRKTRRLPTAIAPEPSGFAAAVVNAACSLCKGWCCRNGADDAFLDDRTLARQLAEDANITDEVITRRYLDRVPLAAHQDSCIFHGKQGCTLDRSMRADICNTYFCGGLTTYIRGKAAPEPTVVLAGKGDKMRSSAVLIPHHEAART
jgi:hypothetical protein